VKEYPPGWHGNWTLAGGFGIFWDNVRFSSRTKAGGKEAGEPRPAPKTVGIKDAVIQCSNLLNKGASNFMNIIPSLSLAALAIALTSCTTPKPPQAFHNTDNTALIVESLDGRTCQMLQPTASDKVDSDKLLENAMKLSQHQTAVVILENYTEPKFGAQFRDRGSLWFVGLRNLGYQHIVFLQGKGVSNPEGLTTLVDYE
jgi:hypothetical protein